MTDALFPRFCLRCGCERTLWCKSCDEVYVPRKPEMTCPFCADADTCRVCEYCRPEVYLDGVISVGSYADPIMRGAIKMWKYHGDRNIEPVLERWLRRALNGFTLPNQQFVSAPVPLHASKRRARGFDQARRVARFVSDNASFPYSDILRRVRDTKSRANIEHDTRRVGHLDGSFTCVTTPPKHVLLCDDVFTSGSTMDAAARCLKEAGAETVWGFVLARSSA